MTVWRCINIIATYPDDRQRQIRSDKAISWAVEYIKNEFMIKALII